MSGGHRFGGGITAETWRGGEFNLYDYIVGSMQVDIIETVEDDADGVVDAVAALFDCAATTGRD